MPESGRDSSKEPTSPILRLADNDESHPLGRLLAFQGGRFASSYRVKDGQITVVNRQIGPQNMSITVLDNTLNSDKRYLPHSYLVHYWDGPTGRLERVETIQDRWTRLGSFDLPASHLVTTASGGSLSPRSLEFTKQVLTRVK